MNGFIVTAVANSEGAFPIVTPVELISNYADAADPIRIIRLQSGEVQELGDRGFYESEEVGSASCENPVRGNGTELPACRNKNIKSNLKSRELR